VQRLVRPRAPGESHLCNRLHRRARCRDSVLALSRFDELTTVRSVLRRSQPSNVYILVVDCTDRRRHQQFRLSWDFQQGKFTGRREIHPRQSSNTVWSSPLENGTVIKRADK